MKITCSIIRDLLPLYAEDMLSTDSKALVNEHLADCDQCVVELANLKKADKLPIDTDTHSLKRVSNIIQRRIFALLTAACVLITLILGTALLLDAKIYLTAEQAVAQVVPQEDGGLRVYLNDLVMGVCSGGERNRNDGLSGNFGIITWSNLRQLLLPVRRTPYEALPEEMKSVISAETYGSHYFQLEGGAVNCNFWYCDAMSGDGTTLLWDARKPQNRNDLFPVNYHIGFYVAILAMLCILAHTSEYVMKRYWTPRMREIAIHLGMLAGSLSLSTCIVSAFQFMELYGEFTEAFLEGLILAVPMFLSCAFARRWHLLRKQDKTV